LNIVFNDLSLASSVFMIQSVSKWH